MALWTYLDYRQVSTPQGKTFIHLILSDSNDDAPQFLSINEDPVVVTLTDEERQQLERAT